MRNTCLSSDGSLLGHVVVFAVLAACLAPAQPAAAQTTAPEVFLEQLTTGLTFPTDVVNAGDGSNRLFIAQQDGRILIYDLNENRLLPEPFLDLSGLVSFQEDAGLLSVAFHPHYETNGRFYVHYVDANQAGTIARFTVSADPNRANPQPDGIVLSIPHPDQSDEHYGGQIQFGPDGFLYVAVGDGNVLENGQDLSVLRGKMLRLDVDTAEPYAAPPTNPFVGDSQAQDEIWAYGLRNPWRFSFDRLTGEAFITDVGEARREEVNLQAASSPGGENYGWPRMEGSLCFNPPEQCNDGSLVLPIIEYDHSNAFCSGSVSGGYRYRGTLSPALNGVYFYGDFCFGRLWGAVQQENGSWTSTELLDGFSGIVSFGEDEEGEVYVTDFFDGILYRIRGSNPAPTLGSLAPDSIEAGGAAELLLRVIGSGFVLTSVVRWNGADRATRFISSTELEATIPASDLASGGTVAVTVFSPEPGGGVSAALNLAIADFLLGASPSSATVNAGQSATYTITVSPQFGAFGSAVALACSGLPALSSCSFSPANLTPGSDPATATLTISTTGPRALLEPLPGPEPQSPIFAYWLSFPGLGLLGVWLTTRNAERKRLRFSRLAGLLLVLLALQVGCSGGGGGSSVVPPSPAPNPSTPTGSFTVTLTGATATLQHSTTITLTVQ